MTPPMNELAAIITASVALLGALGAVAKFVWNKLEVRFTVIEERLEECRQREIESQRRSTVKLTVIELLWQEIERNTPDNAVLRRAKRLLDGLKREDQHREQE